MTVCWPGRALLGWYKTTADGVARIMRWRRRCADAERTRDAQAGGTEGSAGRAGCAGSHVCAAWESAARHARRIARPPRESEA